MADKELLKKVLFLSQVAEMMAEALDAISSVAVAHANKGLLMDPASLVELTKALEAAMIEVERETKARG